MPDEMLSVVDEQDQPIYALPRDQVHALGLRHRAVHILVFNDRNLLFLQKRSINKDLNKGLWDSSAAGHVDAGEQYTETAVRELEEELGIITTLHPLFKLPPTDKLGMEFIEVFQCSHNGPMTLNTHEIEQGAWLSVSTVTMRVDKNDPTLTETFKHIWRDYLALHPTPISV